MKINIPFSVLDLFPVFEGSDHRTAVKSGLALAQKAEELGYKRFWISEHHNTETLISSATVILMGYIAENTTTIRVGSGGIMLPNHTPLIVAEQFGTLATLYPDRIDLGLGRAPGTDKLTAKALRRFRAETVHDFPQDVQELRFFLSKPDEEYAVRAIPGQGLEIPIYLLGSSNFSAQLAAALGLPYAFASHFAPKLLYEALELYRNQFRPSLQQKKPYSMPAVNVVVADSDEEAEFLASSMKLLMLNVIRNTRIPLQPPVKDISQHWTDRERIQVEHMLQFSFVGSKKTVKQKLENFIVATGADEIIVVSHIFDQEKRLRSFELLAEIAGIKKI